MAQEEVGNNSNKIINDPEVHVSQTPSIPELQHSTKPSITEEQKQRMLKNRELAEERRRQTQARKDEKLKNCELDSPTNNINTPSQ